VPARRRTERDQRRRDLGQAFLADRRAVDRIITAADLAAGELVVDIGAGRGALTLPLAAAGARVIAVELDGAWVRRLRERVDAAGLADRVTVVRGDLRTVALPTSPYRVVANPPFGHTTALLRRLLDDPSRGPVRADLVVQAEVARKRARTPATTLRSAAWAPWWTFALGTRIGRNAFRPVPRVDAAVLIVRRREPAVLPPWLAPTFADALRPVWSPPAPRR
jgi:23S rRNA (adenine-N6)-dimethyltransferase